MFPNQPQHDMVSITRKSRLRSPIARMSKFALFLQKVNKFEKQAWRTQAKIHDFKIELLLFFAANLEKLKASINNLLSETIFLVAAATSSQPVSQSANLYVRYYHNFALFVCADTKIHPRVPNEIILGKGRHSFCAETHSL